MSVLSRLTQVAGKEAGCKSPWDCTGDSKKHTVRLQGAGSLRGEKNDRKEPLSGEGKCYSLGALSLERTPPISST